MNKMEISIIIPVYNKIRYIKTILNQILSQHFVDWECILVDDGSTDGSERVCDEYGDKDDRFLVLHIKNGGVSHARNIGISHAKGRYITFIDSDDEIHSDYIGNLYSKITQNDVDMVITSSVKIWDSSNHTEYIQVPYQGIVLAEKYLSDFAEHQYKNGIYGYCWGKIFNRNLLQDKMFNENIRLAEDLEFYLSLYPHVHSIYFDKTPYYFYRQEAENSSMLGADWQIDYYTQLLIQLKMYDMLSKSGKLNKKSKLLISSRIYDYIFFTLFHAPQNEINDYIQKLRNLPLPDISDLTARSWQQKLIIYNFLNGIDIVILFYIKLHRVIKNIVW